MVSYRDNQYEITDYYCTEHEMGDRSYQTDNIDQVLPVCFYFATEAKCRAQLEASFNLMSASWQSGTHPLDKGVSVPYNIIIETTTHD